MKRLRSRAIGLIVALATLAGLAWSGPARAITDQEQLIEKARLTLVSLLQDPTYSLLKAYVENARAVIIVPELLKGGFFIGGEGGMGVMLVRYDTGEWSHPAFYLMAGGSFGLQIGGQISELVLAIMTDEGLNAVLNRRVTLGADVSASLITVGAGGEIRTGLDLNADMYAFSRSQGLFAGGSLEGSVITERDDWNRAYYGPNATARQILSGGFSNPQADALRAALP
jgi:lipid-binding SYLF domain-containing protein